MNVKEKLIDTINQTEDANALENIYTNILGNTDILEQKYNEWFSNHTTEETDLEIFILMQEDLFSDMSFIENSITYDYMLRNKKHKRFIPGLTLDEQYFRLYIDNRVEIAETHAHNRKILVNPKYVTNKDVILHEMIHAHEFILEQTNPLLKEILLLELYKDLKPKLAVDNINLDDLIFNHANIPHNTELLNEGGTHDLLFFLKSIDLDLKCHNELFTIFGYDYTRTFKGLNLI